MANTGKLTGEARDAGGNALGRPGAWASSAPAVASVDGGGNVTGHTEGVANITYTVDGVVSNAAAVTVRRHIAQVLVTPDPVIIPKDGTRQFAYTLKDQDGNTLTAANYGNPTWASSDLTKATIDAGGLATGLANGPTQISATVEGVTGAVAATVQALTLFTLTPGDNIGAKGGTFARASTATYFDVNGVMQSAASGVLRDAHYIGGVRTFLLEPQRTNFVLWNRDLRVANGMTLLVATYGGNNFPAPDGTNTATRATLDKTGGSVSWQGATGAPTAGRTFSASIWVRYVSGGNQVQVVNTQNGVAESASAVVSVPLDGSWVRLWMKRVNIAGGSNDQSLGLRAGNQATDPVVDIWAPQLEEGPGITSTIWTAGSVVTRAGDSLTFGTWAGLTDEWACLLDFMVPDPDDGGAPVMHHLGSGYPGPYATMNLLTPHIIQVQFGSDAGQFSQFVYVEPGQDEAIFLVRGRRVQVIQRHHNRGGGVGSMYGSFKQDAGAWQEQADAAPGPYNFVDYRGTPRYTVGAVTGGVPVVAVAMRRIRAVPARDIPSTDLEAL